MALLTAGDSTEETIVLAVAAGVAMIALTGSLAASDGGRARRLHLHRAARTRHQLVTAPQNDVSARR